MKELKDYNELSNVVADVVEEQIKEYPFSKLALPTGSTPLGLYEELVKRKLNWYYVITFNLEEYIMNPDHPYRYHSYMRKNLFDRINIYTDN